MEKEKLLKWIEEQQQEIKDSRNDPDYQAYEEEGWLDGQ